MRRTKYYKREDDTTTVIRRISQRIKKQYTVTTTNNKQFTVISCDELINDTAKEMASNLFESEVKKISMSIKFNSFL